MLFKNRSRHTLPPSEFNRSKLNRDAREYIGQKDRAHDPRFSALGVSGLIGATPHACDLPNQLLFR